MYFSRRDFLKASSTAALAPALPRFLAAADETTQALCRKLASDPLRPQYHLLPAHNWMNDPNGPIYFRGKYHMFHQYNPMGAVWGNMHWAHATSDDMIHWRHEPIALAPTPGGPDQDGVFSGSAVLDKGRPTVIYTGVAPPSTPREATLRDGQHVWRETQCLAVAQDDELRVWKKLPEPVIAEPPAGMEVTGFRDPCLWREGDKWMLILGSGIRGRGGAILLYSSTDLRHWTYLHPLIEGDASGKSTTNPVDTGDMWECPDFFPLGGKHVLLISTRGKVSWMVGTYANQRFHYEKDGVLDWGHYYAAKTMLDKNGHRILWGWITEARPDADLTSAGWAGAMSLPRVLSLSSSNELRIEASSVTQVLRGEHKAVSAAEAKTGKALDPLRIRDLAVEIDVTIRPTAEDFLLSMSSDTGTFILILCSRRPPGRELQVSGTGSVSFPGGGIGSVGCPVSGEFSSPLRLHMFLDGSVLELFANGETALTARLYQIPSGPLQMRLSGAEVVSLDVWQMKPISKNRLTGSLCL